MRTLCLILLIIGFTSWGTDGDELTFAKFSKKINRIELPYSASCSSTMRQRENAPDLKISEETLKQFGIAGNYVKIIGKLPNTKNYTGIIYLNSIEVDIPELVTLDKTGNVISKLSMFRVYRGQSNEGLYEQSYVNISNDQLITLYDSSFVFIRDSSYNKKYIDTIAVKRVFTIDIDGKIIQKE